MKAKTSIVTGSNTGIGKETARGLAKLGHHVVLACRDTDKAEAARREILVELPDAQLSVMPLDLGSFASIRTFVERFTQEHGALDVLVNNAGLWPTARSTTKDGLETTFGVNHVGTFLLTRELLPLLENAAPSRIVILSSKLHYQGKMAWDDLQYERRRYSPTAAYSQSKLANVLHTKALARRLSGKGISVNAVHPGVVATELARGYPAFLTKIFHLFTLSPQKGALCSLHVATSAEGGEVSGAYFEKSRQKEASRAAKDEANQERLWSLTEKLLEDANG